MSEVTLSDTSIAIVALHQEREALRANRCNVVRVLNDYDELIAALDDRILRHPAATVRDIGRRPPARVGRVCGERQRATLPQHPIAHHTPSRPSHRGPVQVLVPQASVSFPRGRGAVELHR